MMENKKMVIPNHLIREIQEEFKKQIEELKRIKDLMSVIDEMQIKFVDLSNDKEEHDYVTMKMSKKKELQFIYINNPKIPSRRVREVVNEYKGCQGERCEKERHFFVKNNRCDIKRRIDCINAEIRTAKLLLENPPTSSILDKMIKDIKKEEENSEISPPRKWISVWGDGCRKPHYGIRKKRGPFSKMAKWKKPANSK